MLILMTCLTCFSWTWSSHATYLIDFTGSLRIFPLILDILTSDLSVLLWPCHGALSIVPSVSNFFFNKVNCAYRASQLCTNVQNWHSNVDWVNDVANEQNRVE
jgi:hypothetical protein